MTLSQEFSETRLRLQESLKLMLDLEKSIDKHPNNLINYIKVLQKISYQTKDISDILEALQLEARSQD